MKHIPQNDWRSLIGYYKVFASRHGTEGTQGLKTLALSNANVDVVLDCFADMRIFGWWAQNEDSLLMYFKDKKQLEIALQWVEKNHPELCAWQMGNTRQKNNR